MREGRARTMPQDSHHACRAGSPTIVLIDDRPLTAKHIAGLIRARYRGARIVVATCAGEIGACAVDLLIVNLNDRSVRDPAVSALLTELERRFTGVPLTLLCGRPGCHTGAPAAVRAAFPLSLPADVLVAALRLVLVGGMYFLVDDAMPVAQPVGAPPSPPQSPPRGDDGGAGPAADRGLTVREHQVLELLRQGRANKLIAHELRISENTVKVHVRRVMRKLKVTNRTQAAFVDEGREGVSGGPDRGRPISPAFPWT